MVPHKGWWNMAELHMVPLILATKEPSGFWKLPPRFEEADAPANT